jgi:hypothetical protein
MPEKFNELLLKPDIIELYNNGITPDYGYLLNGRFEKDMIKTLYLLKTLSGNPISWKASDTEYLFPSISLVPKQEGSGEPSPENVRPITGYESLSLTRCGKNLLDAPANPSTNIYVWGRQDLYQNGQPLFPAGNYSFYTPFKSLQIQTFNEKRERTGIWYSTTLVTITALESFYLELDSGKAENDGNLATMCTGSTPTDYEPYQGDTYDIALPETVYGGTVDCVTGMGSKTWGYIASYNGESLPGEWISDRDVYAPGTTPTTGAQVAYKLATPEPFQATGNRQLTSLVGYNTIYTTGDSITLSRKVWRLEA